MLNVVEWMLLWFSVRTRLERISLRRLVRPLPSVLTGVAFLALKAPWLKVAWRSRIFY